MADVPVCDWVCDLLPLTSHLFFMMFQLIHHTPCALEWNSTHMNPWRLKKSSQGIFLFLHIYSATCIPSESLLSSRLDIPIICIRTPPGSRLCSKHYVPLILNGLGIFSGESLTFRKYYLYKEAMVMRGRLSENIWQWGANKSRCEQMQREALVCLLDLSLAGRQISRQNRH